MKKFISVIVATAILSAQVALARETNYFNEKELPTTDYSQMVYEPVSDAKAIELYNQITELVQLPFSDANKEILTGYLDELNYEIKHADTMSCLAYIVQSKNNTPENTAKTEADNQAKVSISQYIQKACLAITNTPYRDVLVEYLGDEEAVIDLEENAYSDKFFELQAEEAALVSEYYANELGTQTITDRDGNELDLYGIYDAMSSIENEEDIDYYNNLYVEYVKQSNVTLGEIYLRIVNVHNEMATEAGYDSYAEYAYENLFGRDYTPAESLEFGKNVEELIIPVRKELSDYYMNVYNSDISLSDDEVILTVGSHLDDISSELATSFQYLQDKNLLDLSADSNKISSGSAYTTYLYDYGSAYIFSSGVEDNTKWNLTTLTHEFGHFNSMLYDEPVFSSKLGYAIESYDASEVHSQGLELLMTHYYPEIFKIDAKAEEVNTCFDMLSGIQMGCVINELELYAHSTPNVTVTDINKKFREIGERYGVTFMSDDDMAYSWVDIPHMFTSAFYYISYATSAYASLEIWAEAQNDFYGAADKYLDLSSKGANVSFKEVVEEADLDDVFSKESATRISKAISDKLILSYTDVDTNEWYFPYVYATANYITPNTQTLYGIDDNAKRGIIKSALEAAFGDDDVNAIFLGYENGDLGLGDDITREQAVTLLYRLLDEDETEVEIDFEDADAISDWAIDAVAWAYDNGIISGYDDNTFVPQGNITKAEFATILYNYCYYVD